MRRETVKLAKQGIDFAKACGCQSVLLWPVHDGMGLSLYGGLLRRLGETMTEIVDYTGDMPLALEPKPQDPRQKMLVDSTRKAMMLINDVNRPNLGAALYVGHSLAAGENPAEACCTKNLCRYI